MQNPGFYNLKRIARAVVLQGTDEFLTTEQALLIEAAQIVVEAGAPLGSDTAPCSLSRGF